MSIQLTVLGGLGLRRGGADLDRLLGQRARVALFVYLAVEGRASRDTMAALFWPESSGENARHALRQSLYHLRGELGPGWVRSRTHELEIGREVHSDAAELVSALERGDAEAAARLYRGPFLHGVHLVDLHGWESWVDARRLHYAGLFRTACRDWMAARLAAGDLAGAIEAGRCWVAPDPFDDEARYRLIETLLEAGERSQALRHFEAYTRLLEAEQLPLPERIVALVERVRSQTGAAPPALPELVAAAPMADPAADPSAGLAAGVARAGGAARGAGRWRRRGVAIAVGAVMLMVVAWASGAWRSEDKVPVEAGGIAVLPFTVRGSHEAAYLADGMVTLLGTALDGPTARPMDARAVLTVAAAAGPVGSDLGRARHLAGRLGAGLFVLGEVVQVGGDLQVEAAVYRTASPSRPVSRVAVSGDAEQLFELVDRLAARLLAELGAASGDRLTETAAATTASLAAFKAYLEAEAEMRAGQFERAVEAYLRAVDHDSTFAVAHYRLALARDWGALDGFQEAADAATRHSDRLAPRDRALLDALRAYQLGDALDAERRYRAILARHPEDLGARLQLAETLFHWGPLRGRPGSESEEAWRVVLSWEPRNVWAAVHLGRLAAADGRVATLDTLLARFQSEERRADRRLVQLEVFRAVAARDTGTALAVARQVREWEDAAAYQLVAYLTAYTNQPGLAGAVAREVVEPHRGAGMLSNLHWFGALLHLAEGRLDPAREAMATARAVNAAVPAPWHRQTFELVTDWWVASLPLPWPDTTLERVRRGAAEAVVEPDLAFQPDAGVGAQIWHALAQDALGEAGRLDAVRHYTIGLLSLELDDPVGAAAAADSLARLERTESSWFVRDARRALRARAALYAGRAEEGLRLLEAMELGPAHLGTMNLVPFMARAHERYLRGELLVALGRHREALPWFESLGRLSVPEAPFRAPAHLRQAEIHERLGNADEAAWHRARVAELWAEGAAARVPE